MARNISLQIVVAALSIATVSSPTSAQEFSAIGSFDNVRQSSSDHCYGWSLELWQYEGRVIGLMDHHQGLCGDPPCHAVEGVSFERGSGRLGFTAFGKLFTGTLKKDDVTGTLGDERLRLTRRKEPMDGPMDRTLGGWCDFWRSVQRCQGVAEVCTAMRVARKR